MGISNLIDLGISKVCGKFQRLDINAFCSRYDFSLQRKQAKDTNSLIVVRILFQNSEPVKRTGLMPY